MSHFIFVSSFSSSSRRMQTVEFIDLILYYTSKQDNHTLIIIAIFRNYVLNFLSAFYIPEFIHFKKLLL